MAALAPADSSQHHAPVGAHTVTSSNWGRKQIYQRASVWRTYTSAFRIISPHADNLHINAMSRSGSQQSFAGRWLKPFARKNKQKAGSTIDHSVHLTARSCGTPVHVLSRPGRDECHDANVARALGARHILGRIKRRAHDLTAWTEFTLCRSPLRAKTRFWASLQRFGRSARFHAAVSASLARYPSLLRLRQISRLTVLHPQQP